MEAHGVNPARIEPTVTLDEAARRPWDGVVIGAGLAGSMAAIGLARAGAGVLLVDRASFPRWKVCGCCLSAHAVRTLADAGLAHLLADLGARRIDRVTIHNRHRTLEAPLAPTRVVSRDALDAALIREAIDAGAAFLPRTRARTFPDARIILASGEESAEVSARTIVMATGLHDAAPKGGRAERARGVRASHVGLGATGDADAAPGLARHLTMVVTRRGYVGFVHLEDGRLNAAAAVAPALLRNAGSPAGTIARMLGEAGVSGIDPNRLDWRGTPPLNRARPRVQEGATFAVGDAARFVEPVTGEGMAWALGAGVALVPHALARIESPASPETWPGAHRRLLRARHVRCAGVSRAMRRPLIMSTFMRTMTALPIAREGVLRALVGAPRHAPEPAE